MEPLVDRRSAARLTDGLVASERGFSASEATNRSFVSRTSDDANGQENAACRHIRSTSTLTPRHMLFKLDYWQYFVKDSLISSSSLVEQAVGPVYHQSISRLPDKERERH